MVIKFVRSLWNTISHNIMCFSNFCFQQKNYENLLYYYLTVLYYIVTTVIIYRIPTTKSPKLNKAHNFGLD